MTNWYLMFEGVQALVRASTGVDDGMKRLIAFAEAHPLEYKDTTLWKQAASTPIPFETLTSWMRGVIDALEPSEKRMVLMVDCGDSPDVFTVYELSIGMDAQRWKEWLKAKTLYDSGDLDGAFGDQEPIFYVQNLIRVLQHPLLTGKFDQYKPTDAYLLWLGVASLSVWHTLQMPDVRKRLLQKRNPLTVLIGYEEIFFMLDQVE